MESSTVQVDTTTNGLQPSPTQYTELFTEINENATDDCYVITSKRLKKDQSNRRFRCQYGGCEKAFSKSDHLKTHIRTHTGERPYECVTCHKGFSDMANLKRHNRIHTGDKPFKCDFCDKTFAVSSNLKQHKRTHTGDRPYICSFCKKSFSHVSSRRKHLVQHEHGKKEMQTSSAIDDVNKTEITEYSPARDTRYIKETAVSIATPADNRFINHPNTSSQLTDISFSKQTNGINDINGTPVDEMKNTQFQQLFSQTSQNVPNMVNTSLMSPGVAGESFHMPQCMHAVSPTLSPLLGNNSPPVLYSHVPYILPSSPKSTKYTVDPLQTTNNVHCFSNSAEKQTCFPSIHLKSKTYISQTAIKSFPKSSDWPKLNNANEHSAPSFYKFGPSPQPLLPTKMESEKFVAPAEEPAFTLSHIHSTINFVSSSKETDPLFVKPCGDEHSNSPSDGATANVQNNLTCGDAKNHPYYWFNKPSSCAGSRASFIKLEHCSCVMCETQCQWQQFT